VGKRLDLAPQLRKMAPAKVVTHREFGDDAVTMQKRHRHQKKPGHDGV